MEQTKTFTKTFTEGEDTYEIKVFLTLEQHFSMTGEIGLKGKEADCFGMIHGEIEKHFPELMHLAKWHLFDREKGPMHYIANTMYWARPMTDWFNLEYARNTAIWPDATPEQLNDKQQLLDRLPMLMTEFKSTMKQIGFNL